MWDNARAFARGGLDAWLDRPIERSHLHVHNHLIQFGHAVCAAHEIRVRGAGVRRSILDDLPARFGEMLDNELDPTVALPDDFLQFGAPLVSVHRAEARMRAFAPSLASSRHPLAVQRGPML